MARPNPITSRRGETQRLLPRRLAWAAALSGCVAAAAITPSTEASKIAVKPQSGTPYELQIEKVGGQHPEALFVVLDGDEYFAAATDVATNLAANGSIPPTLIVGVRATGDNLDPQDARLRDYTDNVRDELKPERVRRLNVETGGVERFVAALSSDILPAIPGRGDIHRRCSTVFGHSLGGLAILHILADRPDTFASYVSSSPSIWWGGRSILARLEALKPKPARARPRLLITVGALEESADTPAAPGTPQFSMIRNARAAARIAQTQRRSVTASFRIFDGRTHVTAARDALRSGLLFMAQCSRKGNAPPAQSHTATHQGGGK